MGDKKYGTIRNYKNACRYHIIPYIGQCRLSDLKPHMIQTLYNRLQRGEDDKPSLSPKTIRSAGGYTLAPLKNDRERLLTPPPTLLALLKERKHEQMQQRMKAGLAWHGWGSAEEQNTWFVFTTEFGDHYCPQTVYDHFKRIARQIGAEKANVHSLRHTYAVLCLQNGDDVKTVQSNLGHATAAFTLDVYGHVSGKMRQDSANRMEAYLQRTIFGRQA